MQQISGHLKGYYYKVASIYRCNHGNQHVTGLCVAGMMDCLAQCQWARPRGYILHGALNLASYCWLSLLPWFDTDAIDSTCTCMLLALTAHDCTYPWPACGRCMHAWVWMGGYANFSVQDTHVPVQCMLCLLPLNQHAVSNCYTGYPRKCRLWIGTVPYSAHNAPHPYTTPISCTQCTTPIHTEDHI